MALRIRESKKQLIKEYKQLARIADMRLRALEKLAAREETDASGEVYRPYKGALEFAYRRAEVDTSKWAKSSGKVLDKPRFKIALPETATKAQIKARINDIENFLEMETSTKSGIDANFRQIAQTMSDKYGTPVDWFDMRLYYELEINKKFDELFGSGDALKVVGQIIKDQHEIMRDIEKYKESIVYIDPETDKRNTVVEDEIRKALDENFEDLLQARFVIMGDKK